MLSPTVGAAHHSTGQTQYDVGNRSTAQPNFQQTNRPSYQHRTNRPNTTYGTGGGSQDARSSPAPSGQQHAFTGGGGVNRQGPGGPIDAVPNEQQVYVKNLPSDTIEKDLKEFIEGMGFGGLLDVKIRRKTFQGPQQQPLTSCFAFVAFDSAENAQKLIERKTLLFRNTEIRVDEKKPMGGGGGGVGNFQHNGSRPYASSGGVNTGGGGGLGRGGGGGHPNPRGGMAQRGGSAPGRPMGPSGYNPGGGGNRPPGPRTFRQSTTGQSGGQGGGGGHPQ